MQPNFPTERAPRLRELLRLVDQLTVDVDRLWKRAERTSQGVRLGGTIENYVAPTTTTATTTSSTTTSECPCEADCISVLFPAFGNALIAGGTTWVASGASFLLHRVSGHCWWEYDEAGVFIRYATNPSVDGASVTIVTTDGTISWITTDPDEACNLVHFNSQSGYDTYPDSLGIVGGTCP